jgi:hypothetical protein
MIYAIDIPIYLGDPFGTSAISTGINNVAASYVWETVTVHLPPLLAAVVAEIEGLEGEI